MPRSVSYYSPDTAFGHQKVQITLMCWAFSAVRIIEVPGFSRGPCGLEAMEWAITQLYESLIPDNEGPALINLLNPAGEVLECVDDNDEGEDWLRPFITDLRIIEWVRPTLNEVRAKNGAEPLADGDGPYNPDGKPIPSETRPLGSIALQEATWGPILNIPMPTDTDMLLVCTNGAEHHPAAIFLPHQLSVTIAQDLLEMNGVTSLTVMPYRNEDKVDITKDEIAALMATRAKTIDPTS